MDIIVAIGKTFEFQFLALLVIGARLYGFLSNTMLLPQAIGGRTTRGLVVLILSLPLIASIEAEPLSPKDFSFDLIAIIIVEYFKGYVLGFAIGWIFWAMEAVGNVIDNQRGAAIATAVNPLLGQEASPLAILYSQAMISYFYAVGGIFVFLNIFYLSFKIWPAGSFLPSVSTAAAPAILGIFGEAFHVMFLLAAPLVLLMFIAEFALAMVSRFSPQIQVFILAMPIKSALVTLMLIFYFKMSLDYMVTPPIKFYNNANTAIQALGGSEFYQDVINPGQGVP